MTIIKSILTDVATLVGAAITPVIFSISTLSRVFRERETIFGFVVIFAALMIRLFHLLSVGIYNPRTAPDTSGFIKQCALMSTAPLGYVLNPVNITFAGFNIPFCSVYTLTNGSIESMDCVEGSRQND